MEKSAHGMHYGRVSMLPARSLPSPFLCLLLLILPAATLCFDLGTVLLAFSGQHHVQPCPTQCLCTQQRADDLLQKYVSKYLPYMGRHMNPGLESQMRSFVASVTAWFGNIADLRCHLAEGESINLTDVLQASSLSFRSVLISCQAGARVIWDVSPDNGVLNVLDISGCNLEKSEESLKMAVPKNLWILDVDGISSGAADHLDLSPATHLQVLSFTNSHLSELPADWSNTFLQNLKFLNLAHNGLHYYDCEVKVRDLLALSMDNNLLSKLPSCVVYGPKYSGHLSFRHNSIENLEPLYDNVSEPSQTRMKSQAQISSIDLSHNKLSNLHALRKMQGFWGLDVSYNSLSSIAPDTFSRLPGIAWLDLSYNWLDQVPEGLLCNLVKIHHLNLSHNFLRSFEYDQSPFSSKIVTLDLRHNRLIYPPFANSDYVPPFLSRISIAGNPFRCDCQLEAFLDIHDKQSRSIKANWFTYGNIISKFKARVKEKKKIFVDTHSLICSQPTDMKGAHLSSLSFAEFCPLLRSCPKPCKCKLIKEGAKRVSVDCSQQETLTELPPVLPMLTNASIVLYVNRSNLKRLDHRPYLHLVTELHAGYSKLISVASEAVEALQNVSVLDLRGNRLRALPAVTQSLYMPVVTNISLSGNPWTCGCHDLWMADWLSKHSKALVDVENIRCRWTGKPVTQLISSDLTCGMLYYLPLAIAITILAGVLAPCIWLLAKFKLEVLVFIHSSFGLRPLEICKYNKTKPYLFDIFVSFSQHDYKWVMEKLVERLENRTRPYRLCIHLRDFPVGAPIEDSITWAAENSRCTLLVLSRDLLTNEWSHQDFRRAHASLLKERKARLLIVVHGPLDARNLDRELLNYLRYHVYLKTEENMFWSKLEYALPDPQDVVLMTMMPGVSSARPPKDWQNLELNCDPPVAMAAGDVSPMKTTGPSISALSESG